jgi:hypothetical protein
MRRCKKCGQAFDGGYCPACGEPEREPVAVQREIKRSSNIATVVALGGLFGVLLAAHLYPPLDMAPVMGLALVLFFVPLLTTIVLTRRKRFALHAPFVRSIYAWAGVALVTFAALLFLNGALDKSSPVEAKTSVIRKSVSRGRGGPSYSLTVAPSWRLGRDDEGLEVNGATFSIVRTGQLVRVVVHRGAFGLPWFSAVRPD